MDHAKLDEALRRADALGAGTSADRGKVEITLVCSNTDFVRPMIRFFQICKIVAGGGHSFKVEADRSMWNEYAEPLRFGLNGDGADRIFEVLVNGKKVPEVKRKDFKK